MSVATVLFAVVSALAVFVIAAVVVGREAQRLDMVAPRVIYDIDEAAEFVARELPSNTQARLTMDEVRQLLLAHLSWMNDKGLTPFDVTDRVQNISIPVVVDEDTLAAYLLKEASRRGVEILDDVDVVHVADAHMGYFAAIGAVGPKADQI
jgi:putative Ca2+/H+ antiporter (TMEM165/GDT1 family)